LRLSQRRVAPLLAENILTRTSAEKSRGGIALKGKDTFVVSPDSRAWVHHGKAVGLATSGSGDVLAGMMAGLLARELPGQVPGLLAESRRSGARDSSPGSRR